MKHSSRHSSQLGSLILMAAAIAATFGATPRATAQSIVTIGGDGAAAFSGDGGQAALAAFDQPRGMALDATGNIYFADIANSRVRRIAVNGIVTTVAGTGVAGFSGDGGPATAAMLSGPQAVLIDASGNLIIADTQNRRIRLVNPAGIITTMAGTGVQGFSGDGGPALQAMVWQAVDLAMDTRGSIYYADSSAQRVRKIATTGIITTVAGNGTAGYGGDNSLATLAMLNFPVSIALDSSNNLYIADANNFAIRMVNEIGNITTVAGNGSEGFLGDGGPAISAMLNYPSGVRAGSPGTFYIADSSNNRVRVVSNGTISTVAGIANNGFSGDGGPAIAAMLNYPWSLALDAAGNVLIGDSANNRIRMVFLAALGPPSLGANGTVNAASYAIATAANGGIAPGSIVAIFGSNLASATGGALALPLPTTLVDTTVTMNGVAVPLFYVTVGQVNAQVPYNLGAGTVSIQVTRGSQTTLTQTAQVAAASPGVFAINASGSGAGVFLHASYLPVTAASPAQPGETILIYCTGLGATNPAVTSGSGAPSSPPATTVLVPTLTIGGLPSAVSFSGLAPTFVGLYQINALIPSGLPSGSAQVILKMNGVSSNVTTLFTQ
jgi:uncharacterized protein (TIGR03437 family)